MRKDYQDFISRTLILDDLHDFINGIYFVRLITPGGNFIHKVIRVNNPL